VAIEVSRQFRENQSDAKLDKALKIAKITQLNASASKARQEAFQITQNLYGVSGDN
jgi:hypothetical protein